jgi:hypothetical protein
MAYLLLRYFQTTSSALRHFPKPIERDSQRLQSSKPQLSATIKFDHQFAEALKPETLEMAKQIKSTGQQIGEALVYTLHFQQ